MNVSAAVSTLRLRIKQARKQYRHNDDPSPSMFHPAKGFVDAYDIKMVEQALEEFEKEVESEFRPSGFAQRYLRSPLQN
jgi:hypothetical protein